MALPDPVDLGSVRAPSRLLFGPHETNLGHGRALSARHVAYYRRRAEGGAGVIVTETASVDASDWPYERAPLAAECEPGWREVAAACHEAGAAVLAALGHAGGQGSSAYSQLPLWAPSPVQDVASRETPKEMEPADIATVVAGFRTAARLAVHAGCDGVEVNAGQHSLLRQFLSPLTNQRADGYGDDRVRFAREVLTAVRAAVPTGCVGLRLCCDEMAPWAGLTPEQAVQVAGTLADLVDYVVAVRGSIYTTWATRPDAHTPPGFNRPLARLLRDALPERVRVVAQGSIVDPAMAAEILAAGEADLVEMTRAQIADPDLGRAAASGTAARPCVLCNQACQVRDARNPLVSCIGEPSSGHELEDLPVRRGAAARPQQLLVVGAGPAGLEAARVAALGGHPVRVVDREPGTGGMLRVAAAAAGRERLALLADWLDRQCRSLGVEFELGVSADEDYLRRHGGPVLLATGSRRGEAAYTVAEGAQVRTAARVLRDGPAALPPGPVLVWDPIGGPIAVSVAETLLAAGREVSLLTPDLVVGNQLARTGDLAVAHTRLHQGGATLVKRSALRAVGAAGAECVDVFTGERREVAAAVVVDAGYRLPADELWRADETRVRVGDAVAPRTVYEAVLEGRRAAQALGGAA